MAQFDANIRLGVDDTQALRAIKNLENKIKNLVDPRTAQALQNLLNVQKDRQSFTAEKQERKEASQYAARKKKALLEEIRLTNALELQESRRIKLQRAGAFDVGSRAKAIQKLDKISAANPKDAAIQERVATSLSRILTTQNELNRAENKSVGQKQRIADYNKRIERLRELGVSEGKLRKALKRRAEFITAADRRQTTVADRRELQLKRELRLLEDVEKAARTVTRPGTLSGGARSPVGGSANTPGSPKYIDAQASAAAKAAKELDKVAAAEQKRKQAAGGARSPVRGAADTPGSPKYVEAQAAATAKAVKELDKVAAAEQRRNQAAGGARSPVRGSVDTPGSPKYLEAQAKALDKVAAAEQKRNQAAGGARSPLRGSANTPGSPKYIEAQAKAIEKLAKAGGPSSPLGKRSVLGSDESLRKKAEYYERVSKAVKPLSSPMRPQSVLGSDAALRKKAEYYERINRAIKGPASSLKNAPARTVLDSNSALKQKATYYEKIARRAKTTKTDTAATAKNIEKAAKSAKKLSTGLGGKGGKGGKKGEGFLNFGKGQSNLAAGVGFPLLFGGGPGSVIGGGLGALAGGFGGSIIGGAIGTQIDKLGASALKTADALAKPTTNLEALINVLGIAGTKLKSDLEVLEQLGLGSVASAAATNEFDELYGSEAAQKFKQLKDDFDEFTNGVQQLGVAISKLLAGPFGKLLSKLGSIASEAATASNVGDLEKSLTGEELKQFRKRKAELQKTTTGAFGSTTSQPLSAADEETLFKEFGKKTEEKKQVLDVDTQITAEMDRQLLLAEKTTAVEAGRLTNRRDTQAAIASEVQVQASLNNLAKINLNLENEKEKTKRRLLELDKKLAQEQLKQSQIAQQNAIQQAQLQIYKDEENARIATLKVDDQIYGLKAKQLALTQTAEQQAAQQIALSQIEQSQKEDILRAEFALRKLDIKETEVLIAEAVLLEAKVSKLKEEALLKEKAIQQAEALRLVGLEQFNQQQELNALLAEQNALRAQQANDPARTLGFDAQGFGFFGDSFKLEADLIQKYNNDLVVFDKKIKDVQANLASLSEAEINDTRGLALKKQLADLVNSEAAYKKLQPAINAAALEQQRFNDALAAVTPGVNALVGGLQEVVAGTKTAEEAFADFLRTIADQLVQTAATMIAQYIALGIARMFAFGGTPSSGFNLSGGGSSTGSGGLPGIDSLGGLFNGSLPFVGSGTDSFLADGGTANGGQPYIVGENGPELFIPGVTGTVSNNDQFEAAFDAMSSTSGSSSATGEGGLGGSEVSSAFAQNNSTITSTSSYMKERAMERESQTTIGSAGSMVIETQVINNVEYATVEQMRLSNAATAKQARAQVFADLKNKPSARAAVGMR